MMLSKKLLVGVVGALWLAAPASALLISYDMTGSSMSIVNAGGACTELAPCSVAVTGTVTIFDDEAGSVSITNMNLAHAGYEVGSPGLISVVIERDPITLSQAVPVVGAGSTLSSLTTFGLGNLHQKGTTTCTPGLFPCVLAGLPDGVSPLNGVVPVDLLDWIFDGARDFTAEFIYTQDPQATETLSLVGTATIIPEPGTALLMALGLTSMGIRRRLTS